jgi:hypothetical protein
VRPGEPVELGAYTYACKRDHRDGTRVKSQWTIPVEDEHASFVLGIDSDWVSGQSAWGLHLRDGAADYLGRSAVSPGPSVNLSIAFFQLASSTCHGYPSDPKRSIRELPPEAVKSDWLSKGYLRSSVVRKLGRGLTCKL